MKRSRIFLGATTALLAIAGVAAAKASHFGANLTRYFCTKDVSVKNHPVCAPFATRLIYDDNSQNIGKIVIAGGTYTLYYNQSAATPTCGTINSPSNLACTHVFKYTGVN
jgi:hypothetical protein